MPPSAAGPPAPKTQPIPATPSPASWRVWWGAARPKTLWAGFAPVVLGAALAAQAGAAHWPTVALCLLTAISVQIGANLANDYFDYVKGADTPDRLGPVRATAAGLVPPATMKRAFILAFAVTFAAALALAVRGGWPILVLGALCIACGILYTGGPYPLGYHGLGDVFAFIFFGPVAVGATYYLQTHALSWPVVAAGAAPGLFAVALITVNNLRDIGSDRQAGKRTLAVRFGRHFARCEYVATVLLALALPPLLWRLAGLGSAWTLLPLASLALAVPAMVMVWRHTDGPTLNRALAMTGQLELLFSLLYAAGLVL